jgi:predicted ArsR family transcriptional regulator
MTKERTAAEAIETVALLDEPNRLRLYELVAASQEPVGRDDAAAAVGISRELAAFHLDRLAEGGLLATEYRRRNGRTGPGAGRPAKLYRRSDRDVTVTLPARHYDRAADLMASVLERMSDPSGADAVAAVAHEQGVATGTAARLEAGPRPGQRRLRTALLNALRGAGYEPQVDAPSRAVFLRNCPFHALAEAHRELTCGMNRAWADGLVDGLGLPAVVELAPRAGRCCVAFRTERQEENRRPRTADLGDS